MIVLAEPWHLSLLPHQHSFNRSANWKIFLAAIACKLTTLTSFFLIAYPKAIHLFSPRYRLSHADKFNRSTCHKMNSMCKSCESEITEMKLTCQGFCNAEYHPRCGGISTSVLDEISKYHQLFWLCKSCSTLMRDMRVRNSIISAYESGQEAVLSKHNEIVGSLKSEILNELKIELRNNFTALINSNSLTPRSSKRIENANVSVRRRLFGRPESRKHPQEPLMCGAAESVSPSLGNLAAENQASSRKFWLYLSRISRDVTVDQVRALASHRLGTDDVEVIRLVANGKDVSSMSFISFKIGLNADLKEKALSSSTWPKGIYFREFKDNRSAANFWKPFQTPIPAPLGNGTSQTVQSASGDGVMEEE